MQPFPDDEDARELDGFEIDESEKLSFDDMLEDGREPPTYERLRCGDIAIDHQYQREFVSSAHVAHIVDNVDWPTFFALAVNQRPEGGYYCYDGQHRITAVLQKFGPDKLVPSLVTHGLDEHEESRLFRSMQANRRPVSPLERFKSELFDQLPAPLEIKAIAEQHGFKITQGGGGANIQCLSAIERVYYPNRAGAKPDGSRLSYMVLHEEDPNTFGDHWRGREKVSWILGVAALAWDYSEQVTSRVFEALGAIWTAGRGMPKPIDIDRLAETLRFRSPKGWDVREREKRIKLWVLIAEDYNRGVRGKARIPTAKDRADSPGSLAEQEG
jgi:hypothetical protein